MAIEIRQMVVKTKIIHQQAAPQNDKTAEVVDSRKLLEQCRRMMQELMRERRER